jgi:FlaA1/EpsC-like NDP-sugar epimerase
MNRPFFSGLRLAVLLLDVALFAAAYAGAFLIRVDLAPYPAAWDHYGRTLLTLIVVKTFIFVLAGTYRGLVTFAGIPELLAIVRNSTSASLVVFGLFSVLAGHRPYSRGVLAIDWLLTIVLLSSSRAALRMFREGSWRVSRTSRATLKRVLIVGAGRAGAALARDLLASRRREVEVIGFVDDDPEKQKGTLLGRPVLGTTRDLPEIPHQRPVDQVIVAIPSATPRMLKRIAELCRGVRDFRVIPPLEALLRGKASLVQAMPVPEETFLSRGAVDLAAAELIRFFKNKTVLVTGAGGSIGSELALQLSQCGSTSLRRLLLLDSAETPLYDIHRRARATLGDRAVPVLASVRDLAPLDDLLRSERPDVILHAAALKHVAMCEGHALEAVATNSLATARLADLAQKHGVANFTLVSTDKAVAPACVMGASKRAAETYVRALAPGSTTRFAAVRFGNVLGSNGSVLPLFHEQIARGGPVTVTDPRATRFFMTIPEACGLILQATRIAQGGEIYLLDMGEPVRILDVAHNLIRLYGYEPGKDIEVKIIGLRSGEKLHESLVDEGEDAEPIRQGKLLRVRDHASSPRECRQLVATLEQAVHDRDEEEAMRLLGALVPTFTREPSRDKAMRAGLPSRVAR